MTYGPDDIRAMYIFRRVRRFIRELFIILLSAHWAAVVMLRYVCVDVPPVDDKAAKGVLAFKRAVLVGGERIRVYTFRRVGSVILKVVTRVVASRANPSLFVRCTQRLFTGDGNFQYPYDR